MLEAKAPTALLKAAEVEAQEQVEVEAEAQVEVEAEEQMEVEAEERVEVEAEELVEVKIGQQKGLYLLSKAAGVEHMVSTEGTAS